MVLSAMFSACGANESKLDKTFTGFGFSVSYPSTYKLENKKDGISIIGNIVINVKTQRQPQMKKGLIMPMLTSFQKNNKSKKIIFKPVKFNNLEYVLMEGMDDYDRYVFAFFVPVNGGLVMLDLEPAFVNEALTAKAQAIAGSLKIIDYDWFASH